MPMHFIRVSAVGAVSLNAHIVMLDAGFGHVPGLVFRPSAGLKQLHFVGVDPSSQEEQPRRSN